MLMQRRLIFRLLVTLPATHLFAQRNLRVAACCDCSSPPGVPDHCSAPAPDWPNGRLLGFTYSWPAKCTAGGNEATYQGACSACRIASSCTESLQYETKLLRGICRHSLAPTSHIQPPLVPQFVPCQQLSGGARLPARKRNHGGGSLIHPRVCSAGLGFLLHGAGCRGTKWCASMPPCVLLIMTVEL